MFSVYGGTLKLFLEDTPMKYSNYFHPGPVMPNTLDRPYDPTLDLEELLQDVIAFLIDDAAVVQITTSRSVNKTIFSVVVPPKEMGKIIGKKGVIIKAVMTLFMAMGNKYATSVEIELVDPRIKNTQVIEGT